MFQDSVIVRACKWVSEFVYNFNKEISEEIYFYGDDDDKLFEPFEHCMCDTKSENYKRNIQKSEALLITLKESAISSFFLSDKNVTGSLYTMLKSIELKWTFFVRCFC